MGHSETLRMVYPLEMAVSLHQLHRGSIRPGWTRPQTSRQKGSWREIVPFSQMQSNFHKKCRNIENDTDCVA